jgi:hypothetical protein
MWLQLAGKFDTVVKYLRTWDAVLFPAIPTRKNLRLTAKTFPLLVLGVLTFSAIGILLPANGFIGFDWVHVFSKGVRLPFYPPWTQYVHVLTWPVLIGLTLTGVSVALVQRQASLLATVLAFLSLPVMWTLFLGQLDGLALLGCIGLPWLVPLALLKPQISVFACLAKKRYLAALVLTIVVSCLVWGPWPIHMLNYRRYYAEGRYPQDISLWPWSIPVGLILLWLSRGDVDMLMLAGSFVTPHVIPYNYIVVVPVMGRVSQRIASLAWLLSWAPLLSNWMGPKYWFLGHLFPIVLWLDLYSQRRKGVSLSESPPVSGWRWPEHQDKHIP